MTIKHLTVLFSLLTLFTGCASETEYSDEPLDFDRFALSMEVDGAATAPERAVLSWSDASVSSYLEVGELDQKHRDWLNVNRYDHLPLELEPGTVIVDGPAVNDRGTHAEYVASEGYTFPGELDARPWLDFERCEPGVEEERCALADIIRIEIRTIEGEPDFVELRYTATFHEDDRVLTGSMVTAYQPTGIGQMRGPFDDDVDAI